MLLSHWSGVMQMKMRFFGLVLICTLILSVPIVAEIGMNASTPIIAGNAAIAYDTHGPIDIYSDDDFEALVTSEGWDGNGTEINPYIIEGLEINTDIGCIDIQNVRSHFIVRNCNLTAGFGMSGLFIVNTTNGIVDNVEVSNQIWGIAVSNCTDVVVRNCRGYKNNNAAIFFLLSQFCYAINNSIYDGGPWGILVRDSRQCNLENNTVKECTYGVIVDSSTQCTFDNNTVTQNTIGMYLEQQSNSSLIIKNRFFSNTNHGVWIDTGESNQIYYNMFGPNGIANANDNGTSNTWDDGINRGNEWDDYDGSGPYVIEGSAGSEDRYPLLLGAEPEPTTTTDSTTTSTDTSTEPTTSPTDNQDIPILFLVAGIAGVGIVVVIIMVMRKR